MKLIRKITFGSIQTQIFEFLSFFSFKIWYKGVTAVDFQTANSTRDWPL